MKYRMKSDKDVKSLKAVTPVETGVQEVLESRDTRLRGHDKKEKQMIFYETIKKDRHRIKREVY